MEKEYELSDSDEIRSLGSSSKGEALNTFKFIEFNEETNFTKPIELKLGMLFA